MTDQAARTLGKKRWAGKTEEEKAGAFRSDEPRKMGTEEEGGREEEGEEGEMTDTQLYLAIGLPSIVALVGILVNVGYFVVVSARLGRVEDKIDPSVAEAKKTLQADISILRSEVKSNLSDMKETLGTVRADVKSSIGEAKETLRAEMGTMRAEFKAELEATRADARLMHAEVMAAIERLDVKIETKLLVHELEHHRK